MSSNIIPFTGQHSSIFRASREEVDVNGVARKRWFMIEYKPNGEAKWTGPLRRSMAEWLAVVMMEGEVKERERERNPSYRDFKHFYLRLDRKSVV